MDENNSFQLRCFNDVDFEIVSWSVKIRPTLSSSAGCHCMFIDGKKYMIKSVQENDSIGIDEFRTFCKEHPELLLKVGY